MRPITMRFLISKGVSTVLTFVCVRSVADILWVPTLDILSSCIALAWSFVSAKKIFGTCVACVPMREAFAELRASGLYCFSNMAASVFTGFTTLLIGLVLTDVTMISYWSLSMTAVSAIQSLYSPVVNSLYPHMVRTADYRYVLKLALVALPFVILGTVAFALLSEPVMFVLGGEQYLAGSEVLVWVSPVLAFSFYGILFGWPVLGAVGMVSAVTRSTVISALFCIAMLIALAATGNATLPLICVVRCATEGLLFALRFSSALPVLRGSTR